MLRCIMWMPPLCALLLALSGSVEAQQPKKLVRLAYLAANCLKNHLRTDGLRSKSWDEFAGPNAPHVDFVFTVCDHAAAEICPVWPGQPMSAHWGVPDPAAVEGTEEERRRAFVDAFTVLSRRISLFANLPLDKLQGLALQQHLDQIGRG